MIAGDFRVSLVTGDEVVIEKEDVSRLLYDIEGNLLMQIQGFDVNGIYSLLKTVKEDKIKIKGLYYHNGKDLSGYYTIDRLAMKGESDRKIELNLKRNI